MAAKSKITSPVKDFTGDVVGVVFDKGIAQTDDKTALAYFRRHGYTVETPKAAPTAAEKKAAEEAAKAEAEAKAAAEKEAAEKAAATGGAK